MTIINAWLKRNPNQTLSLSGLIVITLMVFGVIDDRIGEIVLVALLGTSGGTAAKRTNFGTDNDNDDDVGWLT